MIRAFSTYTNLINKTSQRPELTHLRWHSAVSPGSLLEGVEVIVLVLNPTWLCFEVKKKKKKGWIDVLDRKVGFLSVISKMKLDSYQ